MRGGKRAGSGRKQGFAAKEAEEARCILAEMIAREVVPIGQALIEKAKKGDIAAAKELFDRAWGRSPQFFLGDVPQEPIIFNIVDYSGTLKNEQLDATGSMLDLIDGQ